MRKKYQIEELKEDFKELKEEFKFFDKRLLYNSYEIELIEFLIDKLIENLSKQQQKELITKVAEEYLKSLGMEWDKAKIGKADDSQKIIQEWLKKYLSSTKDKELCPLILEIYEMEKK